MSIDLQTTLPEVAAEIAASSRGRFSGLIVRKKGVVRGGLVYGDDLVHDVIITGFSYRTLLERSIDRLESPPWSSSEILADCLKIPHVGEMTDDTIQEALQDVLWSLHESLRRHSEPRSSKFWSPLKVDDRVVEGVMIYAGGSSPHRRDPRPGSVYLSGLRVGRTVLHSAPHGPPPPPRSKPLSVAKRVVRGMLPIGRFARYALDPDRPFVLRLGGSPAIGVDANGRTVRGERLDRLDAGLRRLEARVLREASEAA